MIFLANLVHVIVLTYFVSAVLFTPVAIIATVTGARWPWTVTLRTIGWGACFIVAVLMWT
jgi:hypothetical protein